MAARPSLYRNIVFAFEAFEHRFTQGATLTLIVALIALTWLNSPWGNTYLQAWHTPLTIAFGDFAVPKPIIFWISQVGMAGFFFVLVLELKRAVRVGELNQWQDAAFPAAGALGGIAFPAGLYLFLNPGQLHFGWAIPVAADVAAVLALLTLVGTSLPVALRVFISITAILQTVAALLLTVVLYNPIGNLLMLSVGTGIFGFLVVLRALRNRSMWLYLLAGFAMLAVFMLAGLHGVVAGVLLALVIPVHSRVPEEEFISTADTLLGQLHALHMIKRPEAGEDLEEDYQATVHTLQANGHKALSPLRRLQHRLLPWAAYGFLPLFALANAAFAYNSFEWHELFTPVPLGVFLGLVLAKPIGTLLFAWLASALRLARKPAQVSWGQLGGAALLLGSGFMMSILMATTVVEDLGLLALIKISIYAASALASLAGVLLLAYASKIPAGPR